MGTRIISALVGLPILLFFIYLGGGAFAFMIAVLATVGLYELARMTGGKQQFLLVPVLLGVWLMLLGSYLQWENWTALGILLTFCIVFAVAVFQFFGIDLYRLDDGPSHCIRRFGKWAVIGAIFVCGYLEQRFRSLLCGSFPGQA